MLEILSIALPALSSFLAVVWVYFKVLRIAKAKKLVDNPDARKLQKEPVPVLGGLAVFIGILGGLAVATSMVNVTSLFPIVLMMGVMLYLGTLDDLQGLTPTVRLVVEVLAVLVLIFSSNTCIDDLHGVWGIHQFSHAYAVPLTVFAGVGIINSINMIDGINGLSSGLCIMLCFFFGGVFYKNHDLGNAALATIMAAALVPFLLHNVFGKTSRMFIGDAGTMMMGILITWFVIHTLGGSHDFELPFSRQVSEGEINRAFAGKDNLSLVALTLSILVVPIFDTLRVMTNRMLHGKSPFHADKTHLHHAFIACGFGHLFTSLCEIFIGVVAYYICYAARHFFRPGPTGELYVVIASGVILVWGMYFLLSRLSRNPSIRDKRIVIFSNFGRHRWWKSFQTWLDAPEQFEEQQNNPQRQSDRMTRKFRN